jgi:hypothetical protein
MALRMDARIVTDSQVPWPIAVSFLIRPLDDSFTLPEVYAIAQPLRRSFPNNGHVEAKIRQSPQILPTAGGPRSTEPDGIANRLLTFARSCTWTSGKRHDTRADASRARRRRSVGSEQRALLAM